MNIKNQKLLSRVGRDILFILFGIIIILNKTPIVDERGYKPTLYDITGILYMIVFMVLFIYDIRQLLKSINNNEN